MAKEEQNNTQPDININQYEDIEGLTPKKLEIGLWLLTNKNFLYKTLVVFLIVVSGVSWSYFIYGMAYYFIKGIGEDNLLASQLTHTGIIEHNYTLSQKSKDLIYYPPEIFSAGEGRYDFVSQVNNPNSNRTAFFYYCFLENNEEIVCGQDFIYPGESKFIIQLAKKLPNQPVSPQFLIKNLIWERINLSELENWQKMKNEHLNFSIENISFKPGQSNELSDKINLNTLTFNCLNNSPYNYWGVKMEILFYNGQTIAGVNEYTIEEFMSGEKRNVSLAWSGALGRVDDVKIIPSLNIFDQNGYIKYDGGTGEEK